ARRFSWARLVVIMLAFTLLRGIHLADSLHAMGVLETVEEALLSMLMLLVLARALAVGKREREARERMELLNGEVKRAYADRDAALEASRTGVALFSNGKARFWNHALVEVLGLSGDGLEMSWEAFAGRLGRDL